MANWINKYPTLSDYTADESARQALGGPTVSMIASDGALHYDPAVDPYNPLGLPPFTIRCKFEEGETPEVVDGSKTLVDADANVWDITGNSSDWSELLIRSKPIEVLGANTTGVTNMEMLFAGSILTTVPLFDTSSVTNMEDMFANCSSLTSVPLFDTSSCTNMMSMFSKCSSLTTVPIFDTSSVTDMKNMFKSCSSLTAVPLLDTSSCTNMMTMFRDCTLVQSGALALYQQASTQANPPTYYVDCFDNCGSNTETGRAELAQIPSSWGGTGS